MCLRFRRGVPGTWPSTEESIPVAAAKITKLKLRKQEVRLSLSAAGHGEEILVESPLVGRHQLRNVALAIAAAEELSKAGILGITPDSIERGIRETRWPGRFQVLACAPGLAGDRARCGAQSGGCVGATFCPFGAL